MMHWVLLLLLRVDGGEKGVCLARIRSHMGGFHAVCHESYSNGREKRSKKQNNLAGISILRKAAPHLLLLLLVPA